MILSLASEAELRTEFERIMQLVQTANRVKPRTASSIAHSKATLAKLKAVSDEMRRRSGAAVAVVNTVESTATVLTDSAAAVGGAVSGFANKIYIGMGLTIAALYLWKK